MSVPNLSAALLSLMGREAGAKGPPAAVSGMRLGEPPAGDFLKFLPDTAAMPAVQAGERVPVQAGLSPGLSMQDPPKATALQTDPAAPSTEDATAAINLWLPMTDPVPSLPSEITPTVSPAVAAEPRGPAVAVAVSRAAAEPASPQRASSTRQPSTPVQTLTLTEPADQAESMRRGEGPLIDTVMPDSETLPPRSAVDSTPQTKPQSGALLPEVPAKPMPVRDPSGALASVAEAAQQNAGNGLERLLAEPAVAQDRLFVNRPAAEPLADPRYTLDASAGPQRLAESAAQRLSWMAGEKISRADLALNPPELGSVDVQMEIEGDQVRIQMSTATGAAKEMLDQALPRLRELFAQEGLQLTQADVSQHREQDARGRSADSGQARDLHATAEEAQDERVAEDSAPPTRHRHIGLLDQYA